MADVPYQNAAQVEQLLAERETAEAYGLTTRVEAVDKALASFGITSSRDRNAAAKARREAMEAEDESTDSAPKARQSKPRSKA